MIRKSYQLILAIIIAGCWSCEKPDLLTMEKVTGTYTIDSIDSCYQVKPGGPLYYLANYDSISGTITFNADSTGFYTLSSEIFCFPKSFIWKIDDNHKLYIEFDINRSILSRDHGFNAYGDLSWIAIHNFCNETVRASFLFRLWLSKQEQP